LSVLGTEECCGFACGALRLVWWNGASDDDFGGVWWFAYFFEVEGCFARGAIQWFLSCPGLSAVGMWARSNFRPLPQN